MNSSESSMKKSIQSHKQNYIHYLGEIRGYSDATLLTYDNALNLMLELLEIYDEDKKTFLNLMPVRLAIVSQKPKTIAKKLSIMRSFVNYMQDEGEVVVLLNATAVKVPKTLPKPIAHEHIIEALEHADLEQKLIVTMLYTLGLRISELTNLKLENITHNWVRVLGKGSKERDIPLLKVTEELITQYKKEFAPKLFLFEKNGEKLSENILRYKLHKLFKGIGLKVTPHQLRHSYATSLLNHDARIADVSELLGHKHMSTTQIYTKLSSNLKKSNYTQAHPLCSSEHKR